MTNENILDVTLIEPRLKHPTIIDTFDNLNDGESFIIHNDHDPKPLYYQLLNDYGNTFGWDYLEEGPEWWKVKISKPDFNKNLHSYSSKIDNITSNTESEIKSNEFVLNVTLLEPKLKHPTIFTYFDNINEGESFIILNDHDPKPLYFQLLGERGEIFTWEYLEEGPEWWKIRIYKRISGEGEETLGQIAAKDLHKAQIFKKYGLDFCCGGKKTVKQACEEKGLDLRKIEDELNQASGSVTSRPLPYNEWNIGFLADYIVNTHHSYLRKNLPDIRQYAEKVMNVHGSNHPELYAVQKIVEQLYKELTEHLVKEENDIFPMIKEIANNKKISTIEDPINILVHEHESVGKMLGDLRKFTANYTLPDDACASYSLLYRMLNELEDDTLLHIHLENNILFPKAIDLFKSNN